MTTTEQRLPEGFHWHAEDGRVLPASDADCARGAFESASAGPRPTPLALPCAGAEIIPFPRGERRDS